MSDQQLRDQAVAELKLTTAGWRKAKGQPNYPSGTAPATTHWGKAMSLLGQIGQAAPPPPPNGSPSGQPMPVGNIPGWVQIFADDFTTNVPLGQFPAAVSSKWHAYPYPWPDTAKKYPNGTNEGGTYWPEKTVSIHDGVMDIWLHTENGVHLVAAPMPLIVGPGDVWAGQLYGRYAVRFKVDSAIPKYKQAWLLWPRSDTHPRDGEIDFPESDFDAGSNIYAFMHRQNGSSGSDQDYYDSGVDVVGSGWHTVVTEWGPSSCKFILDGRVIGNSTSRIPNTPMRYVIQTETWLGSGDPDDATQGHVLIDWVTIYRPG